MENERPAMDDQSMTPEEARARIGRIAGEDGRYAPEAFFFVTDVVGRTVEWLQKGEMPPRDAGSRGEAGGRDFHISGQELLEGMRRLARERWGCMARRVLERWGVSRTEDVGEIVFMMVEDEKLQWKRRESDAREDFARGYDFADVFDAWEG
ncbi:MAG: hypothetical protein LBT97_09895 [Planctomycetota bacterium]|jgi:uncharacterized repeat protein (TIGR04138 family)|nr:hypothetical protein [Planctomycetota bacterium]